MIPIKTIEDLIGKHASLEKELSSGSINKKTFAEKSKEYADLNEIIGNAKKYISFKSEKSELQKILNDKDSDDDLKKMAEIELSNLVSENERNEKGIQSSVWKPEIESTARIIIILRCARTLASGRLLPNCCRPRGDQMPAPAMIFESLVLIMQVFWE